MKSRFAVFVALNLIALSSRAQSVAFTPAKKECGAINRMKYCVYTAVDGVNGNTIYHLHGRNLDENVWNDSTYYTAMLQQNWQSKKVKPPTVVSVSYGPIWLLSPKGQAPMSGLLEAFAADLTALESRIGVPRARILLGESMGGLNVLSAGLSDARFSKVASLCPGLYLYSPFSSPDTIQKAIERTGADPSVIAGIVQLSQQFVSNEQEWSAFDPIQKISTVQSRPELYLSCGLYDKYGNFEGTEAFVSKASQLGFNVSWHPLYGGHCAIDVISLADFLAH